MFQSIWRAMSGTDNAIAQQRNADAMARNRRADASRGKTNPVTVKDTRQRHVTGTRRGDAIRTAR